MPSSLSDRDRQALLDILENCELARSFTDGMDSSAFATDRKTFYAVCRCLEIISEASRRLSETFRSHHPQIPWRAIMGAGNVYRHDYDNVAEALVFRTVSESVPVIAALAKKELSG